VDRCSRKFAPCAAVATGRSRARLVALACLGLAALTLAVFWPATGNEFLYHDDRDYVTDNATVRAGLSWSGAAWALTATAAANWHPLTWISHMLDVTLFGLDPRGHHLTSVIIHTANAVLLLLLLARATGRAWPSALVAALFAVHPLHVESVAWVAERKDVLSTLLGLLAALAYLRFVRKPGAPRLAVVAALLGLGLGAKPMLVTLPVVLLLLDFWPLGRLTGRGGWARELRHLVLEKTPLFLLAAASSIVTFVVQREAGAVQSAQEYPFAVRLGNAFLAAAGYLGKALWPNDLAVFYPHPGAALPWGKAAAALALLAALTVAAVLQARRRPYLLTGWAWYLVTLAPVIGLVQVGGQALADRYTYFTLTGPFLAVSWLLSDALARRRALRAPALVAVAAALVALSLFTRREVGFWKDTATLFAKDLEHTRGNWLAHHNLGMAFSAQGQDEKAMFHYREVLKIFDYAATRGNLGNIFLARGELEAAESEYRQAIALAPREPEPHNNLGVLLNRRGRPDMALPSLEEAVRLRPDYADARFNLATTLESLGRIEEALPHYEEALRIRPDDQMARARRDYALSMLRGGTPAAAVP